MLHRSLSVSSRVFTSATILLFSVSGALAQTGGGGTGTGGTGGTGTGGTGGAAGISVDANGLVNTVEGKPNQRLERQRAAAARKALPENLNNFSPLRKVSLVRLEQVYAEFANSDKPVPSDMQYLAGLQRIDYLFIYPEEGDIVIAGPAEGFVEDQENGRAYGFSTGLPPLRLEDLMVALRALSRNDDVGCSIDARKENLAKFKQYQASNSGASSAAVAQQRFKKMAKILGNQKISIWGVPPDSHFARTMVEADYLMKKLSLGQLNVRVRGFKSHFSMIRPGDNMANRWWFTPLYEPFKTTADQNAYQLAGQRAQLWAENEVIQADGKRISVGAKVASTDRYAKHFTEKFPELAEAIPAFAELCTLLICSPSRH